MIKTLVEYKRYWETIEIEEKAKGEKLRQEAIEVAKQLKDILVTEFKVKRVVLFGSVIEIDGFNSQSDIDLAVEGLAKRFYFQALGRLMRQSQFAVDLKPIEEVRELLRKKIEKGIVLYEERKTS